MYPLSLRWTYVIHRFILSACACFEIVPDNPFRVVIFCPLSSAKIPTFIYLTSLLQTTLVRSFPLWFRDFSTVLICRRFLERMKTDDTNPETLVVRCVLFAYASCTSVSGAGPLNISATFFITIFTLNTIFLQVCCGTIERTF